MCTVTRQQILSAPPFLQGGFLTEIKYFWPGSYCAGNQGEFEDVYMQGVLCTSLPQNKVSRCLWPLARTENKAAACLCIIHFVWQFSGLVCGGFFGGYFVLFCFVLFSLLPPETACLSSYFLSLESTTFHKLQYTGGNWILAVLSFPMSTSCSAVTEAVI